LDLLSLLPGGIIQFIKLCRPTKEHFADPLARQLSSLISLDTSLDVTLVPSMALKLLS
jgi:hypothetical protein